MSLYCYSRWDGSQQPPFDADDVLDALADTLAEGDVRRALQRLMQRGPRARVVATCPGSEGSIAARAPAGEPSRASWRGAGRARRRRQGIVQQERDGIERRVAGRNATHWTPRRAKGGAGPMAEQVRSGPRNSDVTGSTCTAAGPTGQPNSCATTSSWIPARVTPSTSSPMSCAAAGDLLPRAEGVAGLSPEDLDGVRDMVGPQLVLEKHASGADTRADFDAFMGGTVSTSRRASVTSMS
jgi:hypothetical protein